MSAIDSDSERSVRYYTLRVTQNKNTDNIQRGENTNRHIKSKQSIKNTTLYNSDHNLMAALLAMAKTGRKQTTKFIIVSVSLVDT